MLFQKAVVKKHIALLVSLIMVSAAMISCETDPMVEDNAGYYEIPRVTKGQNEQVIFHLGYTVSYNHSWLVPNWVAYELTRDELNGTVKRTNYYRPDPQDNMDPVQPDEYTHSNYDRGLMAPAADMKWSEQAMKECHYMTNVCPQKSDMNSGDWLRIETKVRKWAKDYKKVYIASGPIVTKPFETIGVSREIAVPKSFYKVCLIKKSFNKSLVFSIGFC